jgi:hypothetical protein
LVHDTLFFARGFSQSTGSANRRTSADPFLNASNTSTMFESTR